MGPLSRKVDVRAEQGRAGQGRADQSRSERAERDRVGMYLVLEVISASVIMPGHGISITLHAGLFI